MFIASLITYITYLYIQNPVVVSRLGGVIMGNNPRIPEVIKAKNIMTYLHSMKLVLIQPLLIK